MTALSDEELVARFQEHGGPPQGTPFADELFQRHYSKVALWCYRVAGDRDAATDLAQEVFTKAWSHLIHFRSDSKFSTWLFMIARNHCFNAIRSRERKQEDAVESDLLDALGVQAAGFDSVWLMDHLVQHCLLHCLSWQVQEKGTAHHCLLVRGQQAAQAPWTL